MSMIERVAKAVTEAIALQNVDPFSIRNFGGVNPTIDWKRVSRAAIEATRITDEDVMAHPTMGSHDQESFNFVIDAALAEMIPIYGATEDPTEPGRE